MGRRVKRKMLEMADTMAEVNDSVHGPYSHADLERMAGLLAQCQEAAMEIGTGLEGLGEEYSPLVGLLEKYCENVFQMSEALTDADRCRRLQREIRRELEGIKSRIRQQVPEDKKEVVFLPYKASMWDSLESVWRAAEADENTDAYVIPIPYFDRNPDGSFREEHYEGDQYPNDVPVVFYKNYNFEERQPDAIYIHNPYDGANLVTSVHPYFYSDQLKKYTEKLVYIPYFVLDEPNPEDRAHLESIRHFILVPGVFNADRVVVQSENMRRAYVNVLTEETVKHQGRENERGIRKYWEEKIEGTGSPKFDKVLEIKREDLQIPPEWRKIIEKPDGSRKKVVFYNTGVGALLENDEKMLAKIQDALRIFYENRDRVALLWRPHPLLESTLLSMRPQLWEEYKKIRDGYIEGAWGIYDDTADMDRAIAVSDAYYGDWSSVVWLYQKTGKPVMIQNVCVVRY